MDIFNYYAITDAISTSGQPKAGEFQAIADSGHEVVINLALPDHERSLANEGALVTGLGMIYLHIPVPFDAPDERFYQFFCNAMEAMADRKVWVHCIVNARVSAFLHRYLQSRRGFSAEDATTPVLTAWRSQMDAVWTDFLQRDTARVNL
ncbi:MAG: protein tyrosine phosphatase family protein [Pseudomonadota bacterium]